MKSDEEKDVMPMKAQVVVAFTEPQSKFYGLQLLTVSYHILFFSMISP
jgi:hypothetical protein